LLCGAAAPPALSLDVRLATRYRFAKSGSGFMRSAEMPSGTGATNAATGIELPEGWPVAANGTLVFAAATAAAFVPLVAFPATAVAAGRTIRRSTFEDVGLAGLLAAVWAVAVPMLTHPTTAVTARHESFCMAMVTYV
jgi:hypothetical protein